MARITRKELKTDPFALEIEHTVTLLEEHKQEIIRYGGAGLAVVLIVLAVVLYTGRQHSVRQQALTKAIAVQEAPVGPAAPGQQSFPTQEAKDQAAIKAFSDLKSQYGSSDEGEIAQYYLGAIQADQGKFLDAQKSFQEVADHGDAKYSSLAKLSLAQIDFSTGKDADGEKILRDLMAHPTVFVSQAQATILLAKAIAPKRPADARKLLEPLIKEPGTVGQMAVQVSGEIAAQQ